MKTRGRLRQRNAQFGGAKHGGFVYPTVWIQPRDDVIPLRATTRAARQTNREFMGRNTTQPITHDTADVEANKCQRAEEAIDAKAPNAILDAMLCRTTEDFVNLGILLKKEVSTASQPHRRQQSHKHVNQHHHIVVTKHPKPKIRQGTLTEKVEQIVSDCSEEDEPPREEERVFQVGCQLHHPDV